MFPSQGADKFACPEFLVASFIHWYKKEYQALGFFKNWNRFSISEHNNCIVFGERQITRITETLY